MKLPKPLLTKTLFNWVKFNSPTATPAEEKAAMRVHRLHRWRQPGEHAAAVRKGYPPAQARVKERERQAGQKNKIRVIRLQQNSKTNNQAAKGSSGET